MTFDLIKSNIMQMKEISRELYTFTNQFENIKKLELTQKAQINNEEKRLLEDAIISLTNQLRILNNTLPGLLDQIKLFKKLNDSSSNTSNMKEKLVQIEYSPSENSSKVSLTITDKDKKNFVENLSKSNLSIYKLKKKFSADQANLKNEFGKPNYFAKISNHFFRNISNNLVSKGYFDGLNKDLRKMNSMTVVASYVSMIFSVLALSLIGSMILLFILLFFDIGITFPFLFNPPATDTIFIRFARYFWIVIFIPALFGVFMYIIPSSEAKTLGKRIDQELPFVVIHMSAIATAGVDPINIFKILLGSSEYKNTKIELTKLMNYINFHGKDLVSALRETARSCPSEKLKSLLEGISTTITSGGDLHEYLDKHSETLLFDYKIEREKYTKTSETFMNIYISISIAAPMIFLILFVIMGSTGSFMGSLGLSTETLSILMIVGLIFINVLFLVFLRLKQPVM